MKAARYDRTGGPEVLSVDDIADPTPGEGEVVIAVAAAGLNPYDAKVRSGFIPSSEPFPRRIGGDVAGTVLAVGPSARYSDGSDVRVGDEVAGRAHGAIAERVVASARALAIRPVDVDEAVAGSLHVAGLTAVSCLATVPLSSSDTVLIGGAAGAVGIVAVQLAKRTGARVIASCAERSFDLLRGWGADPVAYGDGLVDRVRVLGPVTAVFDCHGRDALDVGVALDVSRDRMCAIAGYDAVTELGVLNVERAARTPANLSWLMELIAAGELELPIAATFPLAETSAAFAILESSHAPGKIVVRP